MRGEIGKSRKAQSNFSTHQLKKFMNEQTERMNYHYPGEWLLDMGETPFQNAVFLYVLLWFKPKGSNEMSIKMNLSHEFDIPDRYTPIEKAWKTMFQEVIKEVNNGLFDPKRKTKPVKDDETRILPDSESRLVETETKRAKNIAPKGDIRRLDK